MPATPQPASPLDLHLLPGTQLRVGPNTLRYLRAQQARASASPVPLLATHALTGMPVRKDLSPNQLKALPPADA